MKLTKSERARIAAAYGCSVPDGIDVVRVQTGESGLPEIVWRPTGHGGGQLVYADGGAAIMRQKANLAWKNMLGSRSDVQSARARRAQLKALIDAGKGRAEIWAAIGYANKQIFYNDLQSLSVKVTDLGAAPKSGRAA